MKVAVIVLNYNSSADYRKCVTGLKRQEGVELEIIIVDNCSRKEKVLAVKMLTLKKIKSKDEQQNCYIGKTSS